MTGETPEDIETRRVANERVILDAIASGFQRPVPPVVPRDPTPRMSESNGGLVAANARMDRIEHSVELLSSETSKVLGLVQKVSEKVDERFNESNDRADQKAAELVAASKTDFSKFSTPVTLVATVILFLIGGFATYVETGVNNDFTRVERMIEKLSDAGTKRADHVDERFQKLVDDTVPRRELEKSIAALQLGVDNSVNKAVFDETKHFRDDQVASLRMDIERIKSDVVSRREHEQHWTDSNERFNNMTNRLNEIAKSSAGTPAIDAIRQLQDRVDALTNKFVTLPR